MRKATHLRSGMTHAAKFFKLLKSRTRVFINYVYLDLQEIKRSSNLFIQEFVIIDQSQLLQTCAIIFRIHCKAMKNSKIPNEQTQTDDRSRYEVHVPVHGERIELIVPSQDNESESRIVTTVPNLLRSVLNGVQNYESLFYGWLGNDPRAMAIFIGEFQYNPQSYFLIDQMVSRGFFPVEYFLGFALNGNQFVARYLDQLWLRQDLHLEEADELALTLYRQQTGQEPYPEAQNVGYQQGNFDSSSNLMGLEVAREHDNLPDPVILDDMSEENQGTASWCSVLCHRILHCFDFLFRAEEPLPPIQNLPVNHLQYAQNVNHNNFAASSAEELVSAHFF